MEISTNFLKHLKKKHSEQFPKYLEYKKVKREDQKRKIDTDTDVSVNEIEEGQPKKKLIKLRQTKLNITSASNYVVNQKSFDDRIINYIVDSMSPISTISRPSFVEMFDGFGVNVIHRTTALNRIYAMYNRTVVNLKNSLSKVEYVCTTADIWSSKKRSFMGVTCHWIDNTLNRHSAALACKRFGGIHSFDKIAEMLDEIHNTFGLDNKKIVATITDNGSNFVKAFKEYGINLNAAIIRESASLNDANQDEPIESDIFETDKYDLEDQNEDFEIPEFEVIESDNVEPNKQKNCIILPKHIRCASHTINLLATTDYNNALKQSLSLKSRNTQVFNKCSNLWNKASRPKTAEIIKNILGHTLSYPGVTRWNSTYTAVSKILTNRDKLDVLCESLMVSKFKDQDILYLEEYIKIMKPIAETLDFLQGEINSFYGNLLPSIVSLKTKLQKLQSLSDIKILAKPLEVILSSIFRRFKQLFTLEAVSKDSIIAAVVCPRFKLRWFNAAKDFLPPDITLKHIQDLVKDAASDLLSYDNEMEREPELPKADPFFDFEEDEFPTSSSFSSCTSTTNSTSGSCNFPNLFDLEFIKFLHDKRMNVEMLEDYPNIKRLFLRYNTALPSSAPVERMFSFAEIVNDSRRHALPDNTFEALILLKYNPTLRL